MDRITFIDSIQGIEYPRMLIDFFDQFIALKALIEDMGSIIVESSTHDSISFIAKFKNKTNKDIALSNIGLVNSINIYGRSISVSVMILSDLELKFILT